jgi:hypothetical protein
MQLRRCILIALVVPAALPAGVGASRPNLAVTSVGVGAPRADVGASLRATTSVVNRGRGRASASLVRFYLSRDARWSSADVPLGAARVRGLARRGRARLTTKLRIPAQAPRAERLRLLACIGTTNCRAGGRLVVVGGSSLEVIDAAVALGQLRPSQAIVYKVFAAFGDGRLPRRFRGDGSRIDGTAAVELARERFSSLPASARAAVKPFLIPPIYQGSFADRRSRLAPRADDQAFACTVRLSDWDSVVSPAGDARIWWPRSAPGNAARATVIASWLDNEIRPALLGLMGTNHAPPNDAGLSCGGLDGLFDIYLYPLGGNEDGITSGFSCNAGRSSMVFDPRAPRGTLAHEYMHAIQYTFARSEPCEDWSYLNDATATWAEDYVYHHDNTEHLYPQLIRYPDGVFSAGPGYPGWAFFYSATRRVGPTVVPRLYAAAGGAKPLDALDASLPGGLAMRWPLFASDAWNRRLAPAVTDSFFSRSWDSWGPRPEVRPTPKALRGKESTEPLPIQLVGLGKQYYDLTFADRKAKEIRFIDPSARGVDANLRTYAYVKLANGKWSGEDWTSSGDHTFCRKRKTQDVREVVLVHTTTTRPRGTNGTTQVVSTDKPKLRLRDRCEETPLYLGTVNATLRIEGGDPGCADYHAQVSYNASLAGLGGPQDPFPIDVSGSTAYDYNESGSGSETVGPCEAHSDPGCSTALQLFSGGHVGGVSFVFEGSTVKPAADMPDFGGTGSAHLTCGFERTPAGYGKFPLSMVGAQTITVPLSRHDVYGSYTTDGRGTLTLRRVN